MRRLRFGDVVLDGKAFMLLVQVEQDYIVALHDNAGELLDGHVVVAPVVGIKSECACNWLRQLEHISGSRMGRRSACLVRDGTCSKSKRLRLRCGFDNERRIGRVLDCEIEATPEILPFHKNRSIGAARSRTKVRASASLLLFLAFVL